MPRRSGRPSRARLLALVCALPLLLAACSSDSGSSSTLSLGLTGSTASHAAQPPTLASGGPSDAYAFIYDDQIWMHATGATTATQLTHLVLSAGASISWGPLVWSPNGQYIAYALNESDNPTAAARTTGPIYVVSTSDGWVVNTAATGSLYGHTYAWYGSQMLFYTDGGGIKMYDVGDADPRVWSVIDPYSYPSGDSGNTYTDSGVTYSDIAVASNYLYYTKITLSGSANLGSVGVVGTADLKRIYLNGLQPDADYQPGDIVQILPLPLYNVPVLETLGNVYFDKLGNLVAGGWQLSGDGSDIVLQQIGNVNVKSGTVSSSFSEGSFDNGFGGGSLSGAGTFPLADRPTLGIDKNDAQVAFTAGTLYTQSTNGGTVEKLASVGWTTPPTWSNDGKHVAVTQFVSSTTDVDGVPDVKLNIVVFDGKNAVTLVVGGQDLAWKP